MKIAIGNDHAGVEVKKNIEKLLSEKGYTVINKGYDGKESVDYPDYIHPVSLEVKEKKGFPFKNFSLSLLIYLV